MRETRPEMIFICGTPGEDPSVIRPKADIVFQVDEAGVAYAKKVLSGDTKGLVLDDAGVTMKNHYLLMADFVTFE